MMCHLNESIEKLYRAFANVPRPKSIDACSCCVSESEVRQLIEAPNAQSVSPSLLGSYASSAFLTAGSVADYLYFLPRILHLSVVEDSWWPDPEVTGRAIRSAKPDEWSPDQRTALDEFYSAVVRASLDPDRHYLIDSWVCAVARSGFNVQPHLAMIEQEKSAALAYFLDNSQTLPEKKLSNPFWELPCDAHDEIVDWFYSEPIRSLVAGEYGFAYPQDGA